MNFRNITCFRFPKSINLDHLEAALAEVELKPVGPMELSARGFIAPYGRAGGEDAAFSQRIGDCIWIAVGGEDKILPSSVVNDLLQKKIDLFEAKNGRRPGGKMRRQMKDDLVAELLPRAFVRPSRGDAMIDVARGVIAIDTTSRKTAEMVVSLIREALGSFPALPLNAEVAPRAVMTGWVAGDTLPDGFQLGDECELRDLADSGAVVKAQKIDLSSEEVDTHLEAGKQVTRVSLTLDDHVSFVLGEDLVLRKFKLLDGAVQQLESQERDDIRAELDARFSLMAGEFGRLFDVLANALKISEAD